MNNFISEKSKPSITIFFCDIYGTVDAGFSEEECSEFAMVLESLRIKNNSDYILFGMLSTEHPEIVNSYEQKVAKYFGKNVILIEKQEDAEALREAKVSCAIYYIERLKQFCNINAVFCADDIPIIHCMFDNLLLDRDNLALNSIVPHEGQNNLGFIITEIKSKYLSNDCLPKK